jgi:hypothetical protein
MIYLFVRAYKVNYVMWPITPWHTIKRRLCGGLKMVVVVAVVAILAVEAVEAVVGEILI